MKPVLVANSLLVCSHQEKKTSTSPVCHHHPSNWQISATPPFQNSNPKVQAQQPQFPQLQELHLSPRAVAPWLCRARGGTRDWWPRGDWQSAQPSAKLIVAWVEGTLQGEAGGRMWAWASAVMLVYIVNEHQIYSIVIICRNNHNHIQLERDREIY